MLENEHQESANYEQDRMDLLIDDFEYIEERGGALTHYDDECHKRLLSDYKVNLLINTLKKEKVDDPINGGVTTSLVSAVLSD